MNKIILAHRGFFDSESHKSYRENSKEVCRAASERDDISIIEIDIRKSKDGLLYCYHGTLWQYHVTLRLRKNFSEIKEKYHADSLVDILSVISPDKSVFLDIKDKSVTKEDILKAFAGKNFKEIILANRSVVFLDRFDSMPARFVKILNGNILCSFYDLKKLKERGYRYCEVVFPFQVSRRMMEKVSQAGMEFLCASLFFASTKSYWKKINKYGIRYIISDFI